MGIFIGQGLSRPLWRELGRERGKFLHRLGCLAWLATCTVLLACAGASPSGGQPSQSGWPARSAGAPKRIVAAIQGTPVGAYAKLDPNNSQRGNTELAGLLHAGLVVTDSTGRVRPSMAEAVPSVENG